MSLRVTVCLCLSLRADSCASFFVPASVFLSVAASVRRLHSHTVRQSDNQWVHHAMLHVASGAPCAGRQSPILTQPHLLGVTTTCFNSLNGDLDGIVFCPHPVLGKQNMFCRHPCLDCSLCVRTPLSRIQSSSLAHASSKYRRIS